MAGGRKLMPYKPRTSTFGGKSPARMGNGRPVSFGSATFTEPGPDLWRVTFDANVVMCSTCQPLVGNSWRITAGTLAGKTYDLPVVPFSSCFNYELRPPGFEISFYSDASCTTLVRTEPNVQIVLQALNLSGAWWLVCVARFFQSDGLGFYRMFQGRTLLCGGIDSNESATFTNEVTACATSPFFDVAHSGTATATRICYPPSP